MYGLEQQQNNEQHRTGESLKGERFGRHGQCPLFRFVSANKSIGVDKDAIVNADQFR